MIKNLYGNTSWLTISQQGTIMGRYPGLRDAYERLEIMKTLVMEQESNAS